MLIDLSVGWLLLVMLIVMTSPISSHAIVWQFSTASLAILLLGSRASAKRSRQVNVDATEQLKRALAKLTKVEAGEQQVDDFHGHIAQRMDALRKAAAKAEADRQALNRKVQTSMYMHFYCGGAVFMLACFMPLPARAVSMHACHAQNPGYHVRHAHCVVGNNLQQNSQLLCTHQIAMPLAAVP